MAVALWGLSDEVPPGEPSDVCDENRIISMLDNGDDDSDGSSRSGRSSDDPLEITCTISFGRSFTYDSRSDQLSMCGRVSYRRVIIS